MSQPSHLRQYLFLLFIVLFLIGGVPILFYAQGWRFNTNTLRPEQLALLAFTSEPRMVSVMIDGVTHPSIREGRAQSIIRNISAGQHTVTITKDGFTSLNTALPFQPGVATLINFVHLFPNRPPDITPLTTPTANTTSLTILNDTPAIVTSTPRATDVVSLLTLTPIAKFPIPVTLQQTSNATTLFRGVDSYTTWFTLTDTAIRSFDEVFHAGFTTIAFDPKSENQFFALEPQRLLILNIANATTRQLFTVPLPEHIVDVEPQNEYIYLITQNATATNLVVLRYLPNTQLEEFARFPLPHMTRPIFASSNTDVLTITDQPNSLLVVAPLEHGIPNTTSTIYNVQGTAMSSENNLLWWKTKELWMMDPHLPQPKHLVTTEQPIERVFMDGTTPTLYIQSTTAIQTMNMIDATSATKPMTLITSDHIIDALVNPKNDTLLLLSTDAAHTTSLITKNLK